MRLIHLVVILLIFQSCKSLKNENKVSVFSESEQKEIKTILNFFDNNVCGSERLNKKDLNSCYSEYLDNLTSIAKTGIFDIGISLEKQDSFFIKLDDKIFNEIFIKNEFHLNRNRIINDKLKIFPDTIPQYLFNVKGKYIQSLKVLGKYDWKIKKYYFGILKDPGIPSHLFNEILMGYKNYDIMNDDIRLLFALHYLLLNKKQMEMKKSEDKLNLELKFD